MGSDLAEAKKKWAEDRNESGLAERTIKDYRSYYKPLDPVFGKIDINKIRPEFLLRYYHERSSKYRAKQEIKFLSVLFNWAWA